jgi:hypothetical protein
MIRAVIDQKAFEQLVSGKSVTIQGTALRLVSGNVDVELILSDIGLESMMACIRQAAVLPQVPIVDSLDVVMRREREREEATSRLYLMEQGWEQVLNQEEDECELWKCSFKTREKWPARIGRDHATPHFWDLDEAMLLQKQIDECRAAMASPAPFDTIRRIKIEWEALGLRCKCCESDACYICEITHLLNEAVSSEPK